MKGERQCRTPQVLCCRAGNAEHYRWSAAGLAVQDTTPQVHSCRAGNGGHCKCSAAGLAMQDTVSALLQGWQCRTPQVLCCRARADSDKGKLELTIGVREKIASVIPWSAWPAGFQGETALSVGR